MNKTTMIGFLQGPQEVIADVVSIMLRATNRDLLSILLQCVAPVILLLVSMGGIDTGE